MKIVCFSLLTIILLSCNKSKEKDLSAKQNDTIVVYNSVNYAMQSGNKKNNKKIFKIIDTACINGNNRAAKEIRKGHYIYYFGAGFGYSNDKMEYVKKAFTKKGILVNYYIVGCSGPIQDGEFKFQCYEKAMNAAFEKKYGTKFLNSVKKDHDLFYQEYVDKKYNEN
ncbi:hypothetical protein AAEO56_16050 [Flavobacterium sp. DGU11]|uniref:Lipoprotein n=1 Tax=Flavobacterium arundinis TaxID=3139143 RepID=A0ABU9I0N8_9FLAO